ncbi:unnamed protein product [Periconia digitata]|uniref:Uncharacterized protein n=1 Tax=Periconia digitata TaxID=1303443 RepID=A0A9W4XPP0_9PLEO|nr:unnamed protein product [Periconia digitata]
MAKISCWIDNVSLNRYVNLLGMMMPADETQTISGIISTGSFSFILSKYLDFYF